MHQDYEDGQHERVTEGRKTWEEWTEQERLNFLTVNEFGPSFAVFAWPMLPYTIKEAVLFLNEKEGCSYNVFAKCGHCKYIYCMEEQVVFKCPKCTSKSVAWVYQSPTSHDDAIKTLERLRATGEEPEAELTEGDKKDIAELEKLYKL